MLGILCPVCQLVQQRGSAHAHYKMTDYMLDDYFRSGDDQSAGVECVAYREEDLQTCPCRSCETYRGRQLANNIYEDLYDVEMNRLKEAVKKPFYNGWVCPK